ncbi:hypothetical protein TNCV_4359681 [Trichonephila clavipes]|uniref:Uncharacterized protein n=1 Tax=Trichonephila clavipes TaxID=2585209 RepID=A0A8X6WBG5_TRICX|nr:hypothetical protein TNCV_4359681 [Trichonephila clavipes]
MGTCNDKPIFNQSVRERRRQVNILTADLEPTQFQETTIIYSRRGHLPLLSQTTHLRHGGENLKKSSVFFTGRVADDPLFGPKADSPSIEYVHEKYTDTVL